MGTSTESTS